VARSIVLQAADVQRLLTAQAALIVLAAVGFFVVGGGAQSAAVVYGGAAAMASAWLLARRVRRAAELARTAPGHETAVLYVGAVQRFLLLLAAFVIGMGQLGLAPVALLAGFAVAQLAYLMTGPHLRSGAETKTMEKWG
jgi:ATP synthase protein I